MKPVDIYPEIRVTGETKAPRGWCFYLGELSPDGFPTNILACDELGHGESYRRRDHVPDSMATSAMITTWAGFGIGFLIGATVAFFL